jgi:hypothetical protein
MVAGGLPGIVPVSALFSLWAAIRMWPEGTTGLVSRLVELKERPRNRVSMFGRLKGFLFPISMPTDRLIGPANIVSQRAGRSVKLKSGLYGAPRAWKLGRVRTHLHTG